MPSDRKPIVNPIAGHAPTRALALVPAPACAPDEDVVAEPTSVLVISPDRRFRSVTTVLIARRGCAVATTEHAGRLAEMAERLGADVVVIDLDRGSPASAGALAEARALAPAVGIVLVDEEESLAGDGGGLQQVHRKWGPFESLFFAIRAAEPRASWARGARAR